MSYIPVNRLKFYAWSAVCGVLINLFYWSFNAEAQGPSYMRQTNPVARQTMQLAPLTRLDANLTSPVSYQTNGRIAYNAGTECIMLYQDAGWAEVCPGGGAAGTDGGEWERVTTGDGSPFIRPVIGPDANVVVGRTDNDSKNTHRIHRFVSGGTDIPDASFGGTVNYTTMRCTGDEPSLTQGSGTLNDGFETGTGDSANNWSSSPAAGSGTITSVFAGNLMADGSGRCSATAGCPIVGSWALRFGDEDTGGAQLFQFRPSSSKAKVVIETAVDMTGATELQVDYDKQQGGTEIYMWRVCLDDCFTGVLLNGLTVTGTVSGTETIDLTDGSGNPLYSGNRMLVHQFNLIADEWSPSGGDKKRYRVRCRDSCANVFGTYPTCETAALGSDSPGIPCANPDHTLWCDTTGSGTCLENCGGAGGSTCQCPDPGSTYTGQCSAIGNNCSCTSMTSFVIDDHQWTYINAEDSIGCEQIGKRARIETEDPNPLPQDGGPNYFGSPVAIQGEVVHDGGGDWNTGSELTGVRGVVASSVGTSTIPAVAGITGDLLLEGGNDPSAAAVIVIARAVKAMATVQRLVTELMLFDAVAPNVGESSVDKIYGLHIDNLDGLAVSEEWGIRSEHVGAHKLDGWLDLGELTADPTSTLITNGSMYYNSTDDLFRCYQNSAWTDCISSSTVIAGTATEVAFFDTASTISSDPNHYWDDVNKRLGVGTNTPGFTLEVRGTGAPGVFYRDSAATNTQLTVLAAVHETSGNMADDFGSAIQFFIEDATSGLKTIAGIHGIRAGSDDDGAMLFLTRSSGTVTEFMRIEADGDVCIGLATCNDLLEVEGTIDISVLGSTLEIAEGADGCMGGAVLVAGAVTVSTTCVTATSRIILTGNVDGGTPGWQRVSARTAATSFTITSSSGSDTSTVGWVILKPSD